jgi:hypothetical protein
MIGAARATLVACAILFALHLVVAQHVYPIPYQYGRTETPLVLMLCVSVVAGAVPHGPTLLALALKALLLAAFPLLLWGRGFFTVEERRVFRQLAQRVLRPSGRPEMNGRPPVTGSGQNGLVLDGRGSGALKKGEETTSARLGSITSRMRAATPPVGEKP